MIDTGAVGSGGFLLHQKALSRLQFQAPPMGAVLTCEILGAEAGDAAAHFADPMSAPVTNASITQAHRVTLRDGRGQNAASGCCSSVSRLSEQPVQALQLKARLPSEV